VNILEAWHSICLNPQSSISFNLFGAFAELVGEQVISIPDQVSMGFGDGRSFWTISSMMPSLNTIAELQVFLCILKLPV